MRRNLMVFAALLAVAGCQSPQAKLVGTWKARPVKQVASNNLGDVARSGFLSFAAQGLTIEFSDKGTFKCSQFMGSGTGKYKFEGDLIVLTFDSFAPQQPLKLRFGADGKTLELDNEFKSDPQLTFDKAPGG